MSCGYGNGWSCPVLTNHLMSDYTRLHEDINGIQSVLGSWLRSKRRRKKKRDRLANELEELQDRIEESLFVRENKNSMPQPENLTLEEKLIVFLDWRDELQILHSSIGRSLALAKRMRNGKRREDVRELQEVQDEITDYLYETDVLHQKAREKLDEIQNSNEPRYCGRRAWTEHPSDYSRGILDTGRARNPTSPLLSRRRSFEGMKETKHLVDIVNDAEKIKKDSTEASLRMENEVERLKAKSIAMAKDLVALNKVIEHQKQELIDLTRMKKENDRAERDLELNDY